MKSDQEGRYMDIMMCKFSELNLTCKRRKKVTRSYQWYIRQDGAKAFIYICMHSSHIQYIWK